MRHEFTIFVGVNPLDHSDLTHDTLKLAIESGAANGLAKLNNPPVKTHYSR